MSFYAYVVIAGEDKILTYSMDAQSGKLDLLRETNRSRRRKETSDAIAAAFILQAYLDRTRQ